MTDRLTQLFRLIDPCEVFADIGCDHGLITLGVIEEGLAKKVYATDISYPSLCKAKKLCGNRENVFFFHTDGFDGLPCDVDEALIAGMGGEEICLILKRAKSLPRTLVLQPMKNADKLRRFLTEYGYGMKKDYTFRAENKFYDVIKCVKGEKSKYSEDDYLFGRDNLIEKSEAFTELLGNRIKLLTEVVENVSEEKRNQIISEINKLKKIL